MKRAALFAFVALALAGGFLWLAPGFGRADAPQWRTAKIERAPLTLSVSAAGTLNAVVLVEVGSQVSGQIRELHADFNSVVRRGDVIARIDPETFEAKVAQAQAELDIAEAGVAMQRAQLRRAAADLDNARAASASARALGGKAEVALEDARSDEARKRGLADQRLISASDWEKTRNAHRAAEAQLIAARADADARASLARSAEAALAMAEAQLQHETAQVRQKEALLRQAQVDLERTFIRAPVDGLVVARSVNRGQTVAASLQAPTLFTIAKDLTRMQVEAAIVEADIGRIKVGQRASFTVDAFPGRVFVGEVVQIRKAPQIVQNVVTYTVVVSAANPDLALLPGMTANLGITVAEHPAALLVPNAALRFRPPGYAPAARPEGGSAAGRLFVLGADDQPHAIPVRLGESNGERTEIVGGAIAEGATVILGTARQAAERAARRSRLF